MVENLFLMLIDFDINFVPEDVEKKLDRYSDVYSKEY
jgi:hypothetical protein